MLSDVSQSREEETDKDHLNGMCALEVCFLQMTPFLIHRNYVERLHMFRWTPKAYYKKKTSMTQFIILLGRNSFQKKQNVS